MSKNFQKIAQGMNLIGQASEPGDLVDGDIYYNSTTGKFRQKANGVINDIGGASIGGVIGGSPTVGSVLFVGAAGVLQQDNANLFWDDTNNRLGIGVTPSEQLEITGNFRLPATTSTAGQLKQGTTPVFHAYGVHGIFVGAGAGNFTMSGGQNTAVGTNALSANTSGADNTAIGDEALLSNTTGAENFAAGRWALKTNTTGNNNIAVGTQALQSNNSDNNTAIGYNALNANTTGESNTAIGYALVNNTTGYYNTAVGRGALSSSNANFNMAIGVNALYGTTGGNNTGAGTQAGIYNTTGASNTFVGNNSGVTNTTGSNNTFVGATSDATSNSLTNATAIGYGAVVGASNCLILGNAVNVGIGISAPISSLHVVSSTSQPTMRAIQSGSGGAIVTTAVGGIAIVAQSSTNNAVELENAGSTAATLALRNTNTSGSIISATGATSGTLRLAVPNIITDHTLTLPSAQGAADTFLKNDGSGNLSWSPAGGGGASSWITSIKTTTYTAVNNDEIYANSSGGAFTVTLPASPSAGTRVRIADYSSNWGTNNVTIGRNGSNINGIASNFTLNVNDAWVEFVYVDATQGWKTLT